MALIDRLPGMVYQCANRQDRLLTYVSGGCDLFCGLSAEALISQHTRLNHLTHVDDRDRVWHDIEQALVAGNGYNVEYRINTQNNDQCWVSDRGQLNDRNGDVLEGMIVDITARKTTEMALSEEHAYAEAVVETAVESIITIDTRGCIETFNVAAQKMFGYALEEVRGKNVRMLMPDPYRSEHDQYLSRYTTTDKAHIIGIGREVSAQRKDGSVFPIHLSVGEVAHSSKRRFVGLIRDISTQREAELEARQHREQLAHMDRLNMLGEMAAGIAHEINQPLTAISLFSHAGKRLIEAGNYDKLSEVCDKLSQHAQRAGAVIERVQAMSRRQDSTKEIADCNALIREVAKLAESEALLRNISIAVETSDELPNVSVDPIQIQQVALNLLRNGMEAMRMIDCRHGSTIHIWTDHCPKGGGGVQVAVSDSGCGVSEEAAKKMFTPFSSSKETGMGMGLSICRAIVAAHGGQLEYRNNPHPHQGATFFFSLPAA